MSMQSWGLVKHGLHVWTQEKEFWFLSDVLAEDKELRRQLQMDRLEFVLGVQVADCLDTGL